MSEMIEAQQEMLVLLKEKEENLVQIHQAKDSLIEKWQRFLGVILPVQIMVIRKHGYAGNQKGLSEFNERLMNELGSDPELKKINDAKWVFLFEKTFGMSEVKTMTLEEAQNLTRDIADAMGDESFLKEVDTAVASMNEAPMLERRQKLLDVLLPIQMGVMAQHGFIGEEGYVQAQRAMMDYFYDPVVVSEAQRAQETLFKRAKMMGQ